MAQNYALIRIGATFLTDGGLSSGSRQIVQIAGLGALGRTRPSNIIIPLEGPPKKQYGRDIAGLPVAITPDITPPSVYSAIMTAINAAENTGTLLRLYISGDAGTFDLDVEAGEVEVPPGQELTAGFRNVTFNFVVAGYHNTISSVPGFIQLTGAPVSLTVA